MLGAAAIVAAGLVPVAPVLRMPVPDPMHVPTALALVAVAPEEGGWVRAMLSAQRLGHAPNHVFRAVDCASLAAATLAEGADAAAVAAAGAAVDPAAYAALAVPPGGPHPIAVRERQVNAYVCEFARARAGGSADEVRPVGAFAPEGAEPVTVELVALAPLTGRYLRAATRETRAGGTSCRADVLDCARGMLGPGRAAADCAGALALPLIPPKEGSHVPPAEGRGWQVEREIVIVACARAQALGLWVSQ